MHTTTLFICSPSFTFATLHDRSAPHFVLSAHQVSEDQIDELWRVGVLDFLQGAGGGVGSEVDGQVIPCDDAYLLARFAAGIRSPRIAKLKLAKLSGFGSCSHCPFPALLERAEAAVSVAVPIS